MLAADVAAPLGERGKHDFLRAQIVHADCRTDDVHDGIDGPHFVEMHLLHGNPVRLRLRLRHDVEHAAGVRLHIRIGVQTVDDGIDVLDVAVGVGVTVLVSMAVLMAVAVLMVMSVHMIAAMRMGMSMLVIVRVLILMFVLMTMLVGMFMAMLMPLRPLFQMHVKIKRIDPAFLRSTEMQMISVHAGAS